MVVNGGSFNGGGVADIFVVRGPLPQGENLTDDELQAMIDEFDRDQVNREP
jgi:hypothetical protein